MIQVKTPTSEKSTLNPTAKVATSLRLRNRILNLVEERRPRVRALERNRATAPVRQPRSDCGSAGERCSAKREKADAPTEMIGENAGGDASKEAAERGAADVEAHDECHALGRPFFADVGDHDGNNAGNHDALKKSPEDELRQRCGCGGQQGGNGDAEKRDNDDAFARKALGECSKYGSRDGDAQRCGRDGHADAGFGSMENTREQRKQRLGAIHLEKGADAAEGDGHRGPCAGHGMFASLGAGVQ